MSLKTADIVRVLTDMNVGHVVDRGNPDYTVLLDNGGMVDTTDFPPVNTRWEVLSLDRQFFVPYITTEDELRKAIQDLLDYETCKAP